MHEREFLRVVELVGIYDDEATRCAQAGCFHAACVMIGAALEAGLLAMVISFEDELRDQGVWPPGERRPPTHWPLSALVTVARQAGWLPTRLQSVDTETADVFAEREVGDVIDFPTPVRNAAAHPGLYVRESLDAQIGEVAYKNAYGIARAAFDHTYDVLERALRADLSRANANASATDGPA